MGGAFGTHGSLKYMVGGGKKFMENNCLEDLGIDGGVILKCILKEWYGTVWAGCIWLRTFSFLRRIFVSLS